MNIIFSGYWEVKNNPKPTAKIGHVKHVVQKPIDILFCDDKTTITGIETASYNIDNPDINILVSNLTDRLNNKKMTRLKFGMPISTDVFLQLVKIWLNKILLFSEMKSRFPDANYYTWVDCVRTPNINNIISSNNTDSITINKYDGKNTDRSPRIFFGGQSPEIEKRLYTTYISAPVIKIPNAIVQDVYSLYRQCLSYADSAFDVYDEEIVLTHMNQIAPELFTIIN